MLTEKRNQKEYPIEKRRINISSKRQITIPAKYFEALGLDKEIDCIFADHMLILTPARDDDHYFAEQILEDLIKQGYKGEKLLEEFKRVNKQIRPAVEELIKEADKIAEEASRGYVDKTFDIFSDDDEEEA